MCVEVRPSGSPRGLRLILLRETNEQEREGVKESGGTYAYSHGGGTEAARRQAC